MELVLSGVIRRLFNIFSRNALVTIYKSFARPHIDYCDVAYDQLYNENFFIKIERVQYHAALAMTGAVKETSKIKLYKEFGCENLRFRI